MGTGRRRLGKKSSGSLTALGTWLDEEWQGEERVQFKFAQGLDGVIGQSQEEQITREKMTHLVRDPGDNCI